MAKPATCPRCRMPCLRAMSDRLSSIDADIDVLTRERAVQAVLAGAAIVHLREGTFRRGVSTEYPMLREHRCPAVAPARNANEARTQAVARERGFTPLDQTPPF